MRTPTTSTVKGQTLPEFVMVFCIIVLSVVGCVVGAIKSGLLGGIVGLFAGLVGSMLFFVILTMVSLGLRSVLNPDDRRERRCRREQERQKKLTKGV